MKCEGSFNSCKNEAKWYVRLGYMKASYCDEHKKRYENDKDFIITRIPEGDF